ncbi:MAG: hypothetical protein HYT79_10380 [Elusimicrobia bacterium]|nr:hypothetical protein [Elusimicrobiota bacterium]
MTILSGGNVGIGTQNPAEKLDVEGAIQMGTTSDSCSSTTRGTMRYVAGGTGVADVYQQCVKNSTDTYSWQGTGGETGEKGVYEFYYRDNNLDNIPDTAFDDFLNSFQLGTTSYVLMKVVVSADTTLGSWCSERGDWYRDQYIANTPGAGSTPTSGTWRKWYRNNAFGDWIESSVGYTNYFGSSCDGSSTYGWCSEWGIGGNNLAIFPNQTGGNELYSNGWNAGDGYVLIRFGSDPYLVCGLDPHTRVYENGANVGIGTTSPADVLEVYTGASASNFRFSTDALTLADANSASKLPYIEWRESIGGIRAMYMGWGTTTSPKRIDMVLENAYELDITGGNVGIGTTDPQEKFHVAGGAAYFDSPAGAIRVLGTAGTPGANDLGIWERLNPDTYAIADWNTGTNGIFINTPSGNVGIGTTNTASPLFIRKLPRVQSPSRALITLYDNSALAAGIGGGIEMGYDGGANVYSGASISAYKENATSGDYSTALIFTTRVNGGSVTEQMRIESGGFVGIGTTNASYPLHVYTATTEAGASWLDNNDNSGTGVGVYAYADGAGGTTHYGIYAVGSGATTNYGLYNAIGTKSWANPHPKDPTKSIVYATLEGGENATYWRGRAEVLNGKGTVKLPEHFILASSPDYDVTVQVTPRSADSRGLAVTKSSIEGFEVAELMGGRGTYEFDFIVLGKRRAYEEWNPIQEVLDYVPYHGNQPHEEGVYDETTQEWYDKHSNGLKRIFISNGLLNSDGTVNEGTFARHGWKIAREEDKKSHEKRQKEEEKNMVGPAAPEAPLQSAGLSKGLLRDDLMAKK